MHATQIQGNYMTLQLSSDHVSLSLASGNVATADKSIDLTKSALLHALRQRSVCVDWAER